jgi:hypothetical protein
MWKFSEKPKTIIANPGLVKEFVDMEPAPYDRPLSERRLQVYERILKAGAFRPVVWASATCYETNCTYRVNGKHTSILLSKLHPLPEFYVTVERWVCDTLKDVGALYNTYDSNLASRTASDINQSFAATMPELRGMPYKLINLTVSAAAFLKWDETTLRKVPAAERAKELLERGDFVRWLYDTIQTTTTNRYGLSRHLLRAPVVCAMMATYDRARHVAKEFWTAVRDESAPDRNDPTRALARFLVRAIMAGSNVKGDKQAVGSREMYVKCLHAWNAYRAGESTTLAYHATAPIPKISKYV